MTGTRSAFHTLNGYKYQFDKAISLLATTPDHHEVTMEGVEDIDLATAEFVQCKYHAEKRYTPSTIKKPILAFLDHFARNRTSTAVYTLYAHFRENFPAASLTTTEVEALLGDDWPAFGLADSDLDLFVKTRFRFEPGASIDDQLQTVLNSLSDRLKCTAVECEYHFYPNALTEVIRLSRQSDIKARTTTPQAFLAAINHRTLLFDHWMSLLQAAESYLSYCHKTIVRRNHTSPSKDKFLSLTAAFIARTDPSAIATLSEGLCEHDFQFGTSLHNALPWTVILDCPMDYMTEVKKHLITRRVPYNDGLETVQPCQYTFVRRPLIVRKTTLKGVPTDKIGDASYRIRIACLSTLKTMYSEIPPPHTILEIAPDGVGKLDQFPHSNRFVLTGITDVAELTALLTSKAL